MARAGTVSTPPWRWEKLAFAFLLFDPVRHWTLTEARGTAMIEAWLRALTACPAPEIQREEHRTADTRRHPHRIASQPPLSDVSEEKMKTNLGKNRH